MGVEQNKKSKKNVIKITAQLNKSPFPNMNLKQFIH